jgi:nicotinate-nucleotide adenylyltransferase
MDKLKQIKANGLKIGLLGGSFDPSHEGHLFISKDAIKRFDLDYVWWVVTKQNTLKSKKASNFNGRFTLCNKLLKEEPKIIALDIEKTIESTDTIDMLNLIKTTHDNQYFWIMGSDGLLTFDQWPGWREILSMAKVIVYDRPGFLYEANEAKISPALKKYKKSFAKFQQSEAPAWTLVKTLTPNISSTEIRSKATSL